MAASASTSTTSCLTVTDDVAPPEVDAFPAVVELSAVTVKKAGENIVSPDGAAAGAEGGEEDLLLDEEEEEEEESTSNFPFDVVNDVVSGLISGFVSSPSNSKLMDERASWRMSSLAVVVVVVVVDSTAATAPSLVAVMVVVG